LGCTSNGDNLVQGDKHDLDEVIDWRHEP